MLTFCKLIKFIAEPQSYSISLESNLILGTSFCCSYILAVTQTMTQDAYVSSYMWRSWNTWWLSPREYLVNKIRMMLSSGCHWHVNYKPAVGHQISHTYQPPCAHACSPLYGWSRKGGSFMTTLSIPEKEVRPKWRFGLKSLKYRQ